MIVGTTIFRRGRQVLRPWFKSRSSLFWKRKISLSRNVDSSSRHLSLEPAVKLSGRVYESLSCFLLLTAVVCVLCSSLKFHIVLKSVWLFHATRECPIAKYAHFDISRSPRPADATICLGWISLHVESRKSMWNFANVYLVSHHLYH